MAARHDVADRMQHIGGEGAFEVLARARALEATGRTVVHLEIGEPDFDTPAHVIQAGQQALEEGHTHYGPVAGLPELRAAVARYVSATRGMEVDPGCVVIAPGAKPVMYWTIMALVNPGDEVISADPAFPMYESQIRFAGGRLVPLHLREERGFRFDPDELRALASERTRLIVINSPHNPTGGVLLPSDLEAIAEVARQTGAMVFTDEIYSRILYGGAHTSIAALPGMLDRTIVLDGWSKNWAMTGWRIGYGIFPHFMVPHIERLVSNTVSCTASFTQRAAIAALEGPQGPVEEMVAEFRRRRDEFVQALNQLPGVRCHMPEGAFYAFPNIAATGFSSRELATRLLDEAGVAALTGTAFGATGEGFIRFSYANSLPNLRLAVERFDAFLRTAEPREPLTSATAAG